MIFRKSSAAIERTKAERESGAESLKVEIAKDKARLPAIMDDGAAYERAFNQIAAKESRLTAILDSLEPLEAELAAANEREAEARKQSDLADFERRKQKAAKGREARYNRHAAALAALAGEMQAERDEAASLRNSGLYAEPAISHEVIYYLHLPKWERGSGPLYRPRGADGYALIEAFHGRRAR